VGIALGVSAGACSGDPRDGEGSTTTTLATTRIESAVAVVPDLVGLDHDAAFEAVVSAGITNSFALDGRWIANNDVPAGVIASQDIDAGARAEPTAAIPVIFSMGGPAVRLNEVPMDAQAHTQSLDRYDKSEPLLVARTTKGDAYNTDEWLFGPCEAVEEAYRTFVDPTYRDSCD